MNKAIQILIIFCLCIALKAQAQIKRIDTYSNRYKELPAEAQQKIDKLFFGAVTRMELNGKNDQNDKGIVKVVELGVQDIALLENTNYSVSFQGAEVISITTKKGTILPLTAGHLRQFKNLKYILIKSFDSIGISELKQLLNELTSSDQVSDQIEVIYFKMQQES